MVLIWFLSFLTAPHEVEYDKVFVGCIDHNRADKYYVINSRSEYNVQVAPLQRGVCPAQEEPIDFSTKTLIGFKIRGGCRRPEVVTVSLAKLGDELEVTPIVSGMGSCRMLGYRGGTFWFTVDKIPSNKVFFMT